MWSDPDDTPTASGFKYSNRGAGYMFGGDVVERFLHDTKYRVARKKRFSYRVLENTALWSSNVGRFGSRTPSISFLPLANI